jgi:hypothetical protein
MFRPFNPFDQAAFDTYQILRSQDNPVPFPDWAESQVFASALKQFMSATPRTLWHEDFNYHETHFIHPHSIRYRAQSAGRMTHPGIRFEAWRVELARFAVPLRYFGVIRAFEQYQGEVGEGGINDTILYGNPFTDLDWGIQGTWFMRLFPHSGRIRPWVNQLNPLEERPGMPYMDFEDQTGIWYPAHSDAAQNIRLTVQGGYELSVFWECDSTITAQPVVAASLKGGIQGAFSQRSLDNALGSWS